MPSRGDQEVNRCMRKFGADALGTAFADGVKASGRNLDKRQEWAVFEKACLSAPETIDEFQEALERALLATD